MKMDKATIEIILFDNADILTASGGGGGIIPDLNEYLWMDLESVKVFNSMSTGGLELQSTYGSRTPTEYPYLAYNGNTEDHGTYFLVTDYREEGQPPSVYNTLTSGDFYQYGLILDWLQTHGTKK